MDGLSKRRFRGALEDAIYSLELSAKCYHYQEEPEYKELLDHMIRTKAGLIERPYFVGSGWWAIIDDYAAQARKIDPTCEIEVKEKYGALRADIATENDDTRQALYQIQHDMEKAAEGVCEVCGAPGSIVDEGGWLKTLCGRCAALDDDTRWKIQEETEEQYYHRSHARHRESQSREEVRKKKLQDFLSDNRQEAADSLFGILPPDAKEKRYYTQEEVEEELGLDKAELKNLDDIEFE